MPIKELKKKERKKNRLPWWSSGKGSFPSLEMKISHVSRQLSHSATFREKPEHHSEELVYLNERSLMLNLGSNAAKNK